ncbi:copper transporter [Iamia sp. SCSIO 61187]|uniref:copper transporter n=1 Tax=Iamia sp. SCSIO 61187 TaxID=2722752 RepID=UPI001C636901|nr:copper transporter [Iamia sp. SCSIO 61187]QYG92832.1 copper transporter [Iamia sp. SCSIO 61187]
MINIRYHIVSITAIFLALGIGTLLGSTFLDRATVDQLDRNIRNAEARIADTEAENRRLQELVDRANGRDLGLIRASEALLAGQLTDQPVLIVAAPGVDQGTLDTLRLILDNADADLRGTLALRDDLAFVDGVDADLAEELGLDPDDVEGSEVTDQLVAALVAAGAPADPGEAADPGTEEPGAGTTTTVPDGATTTGPDGAPTTAPEVPATTAPDDGGTAGDDGTGVGDDAAAPDGEWPDVVRALLDADLVRLDPGPAYTADDPILERTGYRYVYVTQPGLEPEADELLLTLLPAEETDPPLPAVIVSTTVPPLPEGAEEPPPTAVTLVRTDASRAELYDTVDDIDTFLGLSSTVTILQAEEGTAAGHYGQGEEATALAPAGT